MANGIGIGIPFGGDRGFTPREPAFAAGLTEIIRLRSDLATTTSGGLVSSWRAPSGNSVFSQATSALQPVLTSGVKRPKISLTGGQYLVCNAVNNAGVAYPYWLVDLVYQEVQVNGYAMGYSPLGIRPAGGFTRLYLTGASADYVSPGLGTHWIRIAYDGTQTVNADRVKVWVDGVAVVPYNVGTLPETLAMGAKFGVGIEPESLTSQYPGAIFESNYWASPTPIPDTLAAAKTYYKTLWQSEGLTLP